MTIGMSSPTNPVFTPVIPRNTSLPFRQVFQVTVPLAQWNVFTYDIFQGESTDLSENEYLGTLQIYNLQPGTKDPAQLNIEFVLTKECLLHIFVGNAATGTRDEVLLITKEVAPSIVALGIRATAPPAPAS
jgi:molecular chaperone DnaK (HSP70)